MSNSSTFLILPGWQNSGPQHWQTHWERDFSGQRVLQTNWHEPVRKDWVTTLDQAIAAAPKPVILIAHSLGCLTVAHWAQTSQTDHSKIKGALFVCPPDLSQSGTPLELHSFRPVPRDPLPFASALIGTPNDPWGSITYFEHTAKDWGSIFFNVGPLGHLGGDSAVRDWPLGKTILAQFLATIEPSRDQ